MSVYTFPDSFVWGVATSSYQIEGGAGEGGRGPSIWDTFSHTPGNVARGETGDVACDHYNRWNEDVAQIAELGVGSYRFSIAWPRVLPTGRGPVNEEGLDFYDRLVDALLARGVQPMVTLNHWDLPYALQTTGGWANSTIVDDFAEYAEHVFRRLGDRVPRWITQNEPWVIAFLGHQVGMHAPGTNDAAIALQVAHNLLVAHGRAVERYRGMGLGGEIGITLNLTPAIAATDREADKAAARLQDGLTNRWFLDPIFKGEYPQDVWDLYAASLPMPEIGAEEMATVNRPIDFLGVNYYTVARVAHDPDGKAPGSIRRLQPEGPLTDMGWEVNPQTLLDLLVRLKEECGDPDIYITENGAAYPTRREANGSLRDPERVEYYARHLARCSEAVARGVRLKGYYAWSLMDNFEWSFGYDMRFGLIHVDFSTRERVWKESAHWYRQVVTDRRVSI